jgi:hypothetical protein
MDSKGSKDWESLVGEIEVLKQRVEQVLVLPQDLFASPPQPAPAPAPAPVEAAAPVAVAVAPDPVPEPVSVAEPAPVPVVALVAAPEPAPEPAPVVAVVAVVAAAPEPAPIEPVAEAEPQGGYASMDEMLGGMGREEIEADLVKTIGEKNQTETTVMTPTTASNVVSLPTSTASGETALSLSVVGGLKLKLELTGATQSVQLELEGDQLTVGLSDGSQFRIPLKKAA